MIPPPFFAAQIQAAQRKAREAMQAVPNMETDGSANHYNENLFTDSVLDLSRYLSTSDLPATPREFFDDLFHEKVASEEALQKALPGVIKIKEEPDSTATSRCSTPESLLPEHDFDNADFPTPKFQQSNGVTHDKEDSLMCQLQSLRQSKQNSDIDSDEEINVNVVENIDAAMQAQNLKDTLIQLENSELDDNAQDMGSAHRNMMKSPRNKMRKTIQKGSEEYLVKRERNNVAVRKSRTKAKLKHIETQMRVGELTEENEQLRNRVATLQKELNALKSFITYNCPNNVKPPFSSYSPFISSTKIL